MARVVVDASAVVELLRRTWAGKRAAQALRGATLTAPAHLDTEVLSALARLAREDPAETTAAARRIHQLARAPISRYPCAPLLAAAWALRDNIAVRDALYVALAQRLNAPLVTADTRLARAPGSALGISVHIV
jgi:predicted nucleic acid-binding protein